MTDVKGHDSSGLRICVIFMLTCGSLDIGTASQWIWFAIYFTEGNLSENHYFTSYLVFLTIKLYFLQSQWACLFQKVPLMKKRNYLIG